MPESFKMKCHLKVWMDRLSLLHWWMLGGMSWTVHQFALMDDFSLHGALLLSTCQFTWTTWESFHGQ